MFSSMIGAAKARNPLSHRRLRDFPGSKTGPKTRFDHINDHRQQKTKQPYPGIAQLVARVVWDHQAGGSSPSTRTKNSSASVGVLLFLLSEGTRTRGRLQTCRGHISTRGGLSCSKGRAPCHWEQSRVKKDKLSGWQRLTLPTASCSG